MRDESKEEPKRNEAKGANKRTHVVIEGNVNEAVWPGRVDPLRPASGDARVDEVSHSPVPNDSMIRQRDRSRTPERHTRHSEMEPSVETKGSGAKSSGESAMLRSLIPREKKKAAGLGGKPPDQ